MGCVFYYVLSSGHHLFGEPLMHQENILSHKFDMSEFRKNHKNKPHEKILALQLIKDMIADDPSKRPATGDILMHPLWWNEEKILNLFIALSYCVQGCNVRPDAQNMLERNARIIIRGDWKKHLDSNLMENLNMHDDYNGKSVGDFLRFIRKAVGSLVIYFNASR